MSQLKISAADLQQYAAQLKNMEQEMNAIFLSIEAKMHDVQSFWTSPASSRLMEEFSRLHPVFDTYVQTIENHANYLSQTALAYEENETIMENAFHA
ncbi:WXG100 family type VII secretion target [Dubosiella newyorkensis]|jgi:WXG100 family type VII secretion target|uniref:ESAT-6-like protein n=1 Tax=Dubosiella newyorkensis TaxID=1862672 RepID=A0A1U7NQN7_9FIRM|nr:WXG100 family type VII secretion target [Dubosiella newyorkensis]MCI9040311.1 WXG100 family type VII secretion target [Dubosiella newyorkensis]OLU47952.1 hypothetical protein BO225_00535 [Dubosiella newyorkensis]